MKAKAEYRMIGLMSGTSLDGLDIAFVKFRRGKQWSYRVLEAITLAYNASWSTRLSTAHTLSGEALLQLHGEYGRFLGKAVSDFVRRKRIKGVDAIASHGHTVFHQPENGFTFQLGDGTALHAATGLPVVNDFRSLDVQLGGEGAPLVPAGDRLLFPSFDVCLNLGGIANLSMEAKGKRLAFDICYANMALNHLAKETGAAYDRDGRLASQGSVSSSLLNQLSHAYEAVRPKRKSLGREFFESSIQPLLDHSTLSVKDRLRTVMESIALEVGLAIPVKGPKRTLLATGGGAHNRQLIEVLRKHLNQRTTVEVPSPIVIDFKEAIVFALLGVLRLRNETNVLSSVTRSRRDSSSGALIGANESSGK